MIIGSGIVRKIGEDHVCYRGTFPECESGEKICTIKEKDLSLLIRGEENALLNVPYIMPDDLIEFFPDEIEYTAPDGTKHKLFLDRRLYSSNPKDMLWARYVSVDESFIEEQP